MELELWGVVSLMMWLLGTEPGFSVRAAEALKPSLVLNFVSFKIYATLKYFSHLIAEFFTELIDGAFFP